MSFDPKRYLIKVQGGRMYLPVSARILWFRHDHPDWGIETVPVEIDNERQYAIFHAKIYDAEGKLMATGTKHEDVRGFPDFREKSETGAVGRALALCGYGTQFAPELDEIDLRKGEGRPVDSPHPARPRTAARMAPGPSTASQETASRPDTTAQTAERNHAAERNHPGEKDQGGQGADPAPLSCGSCGKSLTRSQHELSMRHYGQALCPPCQRDHARQVPGVPSQPQAPVSAGGAA